LLWCAQPQLRHNISGSRTILNEAAHLIAYKLCGTPGPPNNVAGWGRVDILTAVMPPPPQCPGWCQQFNFTEYFDGVMPPALPAGWQATIAQGPPPLWVTSDSGVPLPPAYSLPNAVFIDDPAVVSDKRLDSTNFSVFEGYLAEMTFRHNFNLEASSENPAVGFDGGVLELSTDGGNTFQPISQSSFRLGGYNRTISQDRGSPIAGRQAWSGSSEGFITSIVTLPSFAEPNFKLRWRMGSDNTVSSEGWRVDNVNVTGCHCSGTPPPTPTPTPTPSPTVTVTPTATATSTPRPTPTARPNATPRPRPSAAPRPTPP
jgi:hypothetical protein